MRTQNIIFSRMVVNLDVQISSKRCASKSSFTWQVKLYLQTSNYFPCNRLLRKQIFICDHTSNILPKSGLILEKHRLEAKRTYQVVVLLACKMFTLTIQMWFTTILEHITGNSFAMQLFISGGSRISIEIAPSSTMSSGAKDFRYHSIEPVQCQRKFDAN